MKLIIPLLFLSLCVSCAKETFVKGRTFAGGVYATADQLNKGKRTYQENCMACHGAEGDGKGVAHKGMKVPPRDFKLGVYKFGDVMTGELPHDEHFYEILEEGLDGTAMLPWDLSEKEMFNVVQYIKTFSPETWVGKDKKLGEEIKVVKDPYGMAHKDSAIKRGEKVYHAVANCQSCHMGYVTKEELSAINQEVNGFAVDELDPQFYEVKPQFSDHGAKTIPPDFTWHEVRSADTVEELFVRLSAGIGGTSMPSWKDVLSDEDIWAVSHYVKSLMELKGTPEREALMRKLRNQDQENQVGQN